MKKTIAILLALAAVLSCAGGAMAADTSAFSPYTEIDLTPFDKTDYDCMFNNITYTADIYVKPFNLSRDINDQMYLDVYMTADDSEMTFTPRLLADKNGSYYFVNGENRYLFRMDADGVMTIGPKALDILTELGSSDKDVTLYNGSGRSARSHVLTTGEKAMLKMFAEDVEKSGIAATEAFKGLTESCRVITRFNGLLENKAAEEQVLVDPNANPAAQPEDGTAAAQQPAAPEGLPAV